MWKLSKSFVSSLRCALSQNFLIDMCHPALNSSESLRSAFLRRSRALLIFAGDSANLRLYDWMSFCLEALESSSLETIGEGMNAKPH